MVQPVRSSTTRLWVTRALSKVFTISGVSSDEESSKLFRYLQRNNIKVHEVITLQEDDIGSNRVEDREQWLRSLRPEHRTPNIIRHDRNPSGDREGAEFTHLPELELENTVHIVETKI